MTTFQLRSVYFCFLVALLFCIGGQTPALAAGGTVTIMGVSPTGGISASTTVTFTVSSGGFTDPKFTLKDSFQASGATVGSIDKTGHFTWTPKIYDAGTHTITVTVTGGHSDTASASVDLFVVNNTALLEKLSPGPIVSVFRPVTFSIIAPGFVSPKHILYTNDQAYAGGTLSKVLISSAGAFSWTPKYDDVGQHTLTIETKDSLGHDARVVQIITVIDPRMSINALTSGPVEVGSPVSFVASVPALSSPSFSVHDSNGTTTVRNTNINATGIFAWKPAVTDVGIHSLTAIATDKYGNTASTSVLISVLHGAITPEIPIVATTTTATTTASTATQTSTSTYRFTTSLSIGSKGAAVLELQKRLTALGFYKGPLTGTFGPMTATGVKAFQTAHKLPRTGLVGPATRGALNGN